MKRFILAITATVFTVGAFAGEACCDKLKAASADKSPTACSAKVAAGCPSSKGKCPSGAVTAKVSGKKLQSPKDAAANKS